MAGKFRKFKTSAPKPETQKARVVLSPGSSNLPADYASLLDELKQRIRQERLRVETLPAELKGSLPTVEELEAELKQFEEQELGYEG